MSTNNARNGCTNYIAYKDPNTFGNSRIGHLDLEKSSIQPLSFASGAPLSNLYQVIEIGESRIRSAGEPFALSSVEVLPPVNGRDILAVGKNYFEHAIEFNSSGYDSSDKVDQPTHPVIFTKRATSIIADREPIFPHPGFTDTVDYEGEIGVIIGKGGFRISEDDAMNHVWGYTIINDVTARERQRDHKQFYIGKSPDTFCPMGPIAVPANKLPKTLRVQTYVNGQLRQDATSDKLIFSVPFLIKVLSEGQTLQLGDVIATGTPAGVGFGQNPPVFLMPGDLVEISITGLGILSNRVGEPSVKNQRISRIVKESHIPISNLEKTCGGVGLTLLNSKHLYYRQIGLSSGPPIIFIHGLGSSSELYTPLIAILGLEKSHSLHLFDLEGHGLSPTSAASTISISSYNSDLRDLVQYAKTKNVILIAHNMGCHIALDLTIKHPELVSKLILLGPPPSPLPEVARTRFITRASTVRTQGMLAVIDTDVTAELSTRSRTENPVSIAAVRMSLLGQDPEGYAKGCTALANSMEALDVTQIQADTLIITGDEDNVSPPQICEKYASEIKGAEVDVLSEVGHWHIFEDVGAVAKSLGPFLY